MQLVVLIKCVCIVALLVVVGINPADAADVCGDSGPDALFGRVFRPCILAMNGGSLDMEFCCRTLAHEVVGQDPECLCAVVLSNTAKSEGVDLEMALAIPRICNFVNEYKCGVDTKP